MKILFSVTVGRTMRFFNDLVLGLVKDGHVIDIVCNQDSIPLPQIYRDLQCNIYLVSWNRNPLSRGNFRSIIDISKIVKAGDYDIVHCHTPVAGVYTRLSCLLYRNNNTKILYTSHGFHFYKGAPIKNWLVYYPIEKFCSYFTDTLITINHEDYELAKRKMKAKHIEYVPSVGIDVDKFNNTIVNRDKKREELGIPIDAFLLISVGELNRNKNHEVVIRALSRINNPNIHYMIAGTGPLHDYLLNLAKKLNIDGQVHLLGYRTDVAELYKVADVNLFPSIREGFGLAAVEGMAAGLPLICSDNRGTREYAQNGVNAIVCKATSDYESAINQIYSNKHLQERLSKNGLKIANIFSIDICNEIMKKIYRKFIK